MAVADDAHGSRAGFGGRFDTGDLCGVSCVAVSSDLAQ